LVIWNCWFVNFSIFIFQYQCLMIFLFWWVDRIVWFIHSLWIEWINLVFCFGFNKFNDWLIDLIVWFEFSLWNCCTTWTSQRWECSWSCCFNSVSKSKLCSTQTQLNSSNNRFYWIDLFLFCLRPHLNWLNDWQIHISHLFYMSWFELFDSWVILTFETCLFCLILIVW
jgi:hypothetical protein